ncbi:LPXTG cell wall anchor domain-containing protein [Pedococcus sp. NPDC057267]|uniref:LPXTG cell wall anchor domain-containing protein n=1 Tax=Pedococcus sp. NPDC057267 TaxID=3346077 RepID=UPI00362E5218
MLSTRLRRSAVAAVLTVGGAVLLSGTAHAADGTTITVASGDGGVVFADQPLDVTGTCGGGASSAVVTFAQGGNPVAQESVNVDKAGAWAATLDISAAANDVATASVDCFVYGQADPVGSASEDVFVLPTEVQVIDVTVSPSKVRVGSAFTVSARCPAGTTVAAVAAGREDADKPFLSRTVTPRSDGSVSVTSTVPAGVKPGSAVAVVACGVSAVDAFGSESADTVPSAFGVAPFTILAAPAAAPASAASATPTAPTLANTGSDTAPLTALGAGLVLLGAGAYRARRATR